MIGNWRSLAASLSPEASTLIFFGLLRAFQSNAAVLIPFHPAVDMEIHGGSQTVGDPAEHDLYSLRFPLVVQKGHLTPDE